MGFRCRTLLLSVLCAAGICVHGTAGAAEFFITFASLDSASCTATGISGTVSSTFNLPAAASNLVVTTSINGGPSQTNFYSVNPPSGTDSLVFNYVIPSTPQPYVISGTIFPAQGGAATGTGVSATYTCLANGTVEAGFTPVAQPSGVPTLSEWGLVALSLLLALGAALQLRRRSATTRTT